MDEMEANIVTGSETPEVAESYGDEFDKAFSEEFGFEIEREETEEPEKEPETEKEAGAAESDDGNTESEPEMISFKEAGKEFSAPRDAVEAFAKAVGRNAESIIDIYQKGCNYDKLNERLNEALKDSEAFAKIAEIRGTEKERARTEILAMLEESKTSGVVARIKAENPGISEETARELAKFRLNEQKPKADEPKEEQEDSEETAARLREVDMFMAKHPDLPALPNEVIETWKKSGISLENAFENFRNRERVSELEKEIAEMKTKQRKEEQKAYAKETSPGSAVSAAGVTEKDPFLEAFGKDY